MAHWPALRGAPVRALTNPITGGWVLDALHGRRTIGRAYRRDNFEWPRIFFFEGNTGDEESPPELAFIHAGKPVVKV
jgi:hypothetical protein